MNNNVVKRMLEEYISNKMEYKGYNIEVILEKEDNPFTFNNLDIQPGKHVLYLENNKEVEDLYEEVDLHLSTLPRKRTLLSHLAERSLNGFELSRSEYLTFLFESAKTTARVISDEEKIDKLDNLLKSVGKEPVTDTIDRAHDEDVLNCFVEIDPYLNKLSKRDEVIEEDPNKVTEFLYTYHRNKVAAKDSIYNNLPDHQDVKHNHTNQD